jgi:hypothetical protein
MDGTYHTTPGPHPQPARPRRTSAPGAGTLEAQQAARAGQSGPKNDTIGSALMRILLPRPPQVGQPERRQGHRSARRSRHFQEAVTAKPPRCNRLRKKFDYWGLARRPRHARRGPTSRRSTRWHRRRWPPPIAMPPANSADGRPTDSDQSQSSTATATTPMADPRAAGRRSRSDRSR